MPDAPETQTVEWSPVVADRSDAHVPMDHSQATANFAGGVPPAEGVGAVAKMPGAGADFVPSDPVDARIAFSPKKRETFGRKFRGTPIGEEDFVGSEIGSERDKAMRLKAEKIADKIMEKNSDRLKLWKRAKAYVDKAKASGAIDNEEQMTRALEILSDPPPSKEEAFELALEQIMIESDK